MEAKIELYKLFRKRMLVISILTGLLISLSMPFTYVWMACKEERIQTNHQAESIVWNAMNRIGENTTNWQSNLPIYIQLFDRIKEEISMIKIYNQDNKLIYQKQFSESSFFDIVGRASIQKNDQIFGHIEIYHKAKSVLYAAISIFLTFVLIGAGTGFVIYKFPMKIIKQTERDVNISVERYKKLSYFDALTNLPNRRHFTLLLSKFLSNATRHQHQLAVMFLDLDEFKDVNDSFGHNIGDNLLKAVSKRLSGVLREGDFLARLGGDEFTVVLPVIYSKDEVIHVAERIIDTQQKPYILDGKEIFVTTSIGISFFPDDGKEADTLISQADRAMYQSKTKGKSQYAFYSPEFTW